MVIKGYEIKVGVDCDYKISELPEEVCKPLCDIEDQGKHYSPDCRYLYITKFAKEHSYGKGGEGIRFGTARAAVIASAMKHPDWEMGLKISIIKI